MKKLITPILSLFALCLSFTSCNSGDDNYTSTLTYQPSELMMRVANNGAASMLSTPPSLTIELGYSNPTIGFLFSGLQIGTSTVNLSIPAQPYEYTSIGQMRISQQVINTEMFEVTNFSFCAYGNFMAISFSINGNDYTIVNRSTFRYTLDGVNAVGLILYDGKTTTVSSYNPSGYETTTTQYGISFNTVSMTADIYVFNANFAAQMPSLNLLFQGVPFSMGIGGFILEATDDIIPMAITSTGGKDPYPSFVIKEFSASIPYTSVNGTIHFLCSDANWSVNVTDVSVAVSYNGN